ncbi:ribonuclease T [Breoghania sp. L-A4]|uniref:ribonuclease T2 family protein n=1 Tax=Breoghania sp. L-A4 TaxID=2304600 RepID=UPI000E3599F7|nr:ribonuclease T [Breoghania sp. L-A4]AXS41883.1 ribonuclease T [Breoghania sp. L-A4]
MKHFVSAVFTATFLLLPQPIHAEVPLNGYFIARAACPAVQSIRKGTNPGDVVTAVDHAYTLFAKNRPAASHYLILVEGAAPERRWVAVSCGEHVVPADGSQVVLNDGDAPDGDVPSGQPSSTGAPAFVLAASWQPAFCETRPMKTECRNQTGDRFDASHFALHGLWPQPRGLDYCGVSARERADDKAGRWDALPALELSTQTRDQLDHVMPGTQSNLQRHEWTKHGSCYPGSSEDEYFRAALLLMEQLNASAVRELFANNIGATIDAEQIQAAFDAAFGANAGRRVRISCASDGGRRIITELQISLRGVISDETAMEDLFAEAATTQTGCSGGTVDPVGLQ